MNIKQYMQALGQNARSASRDMARASSEDKNSALATIANLINADRQQLMLANQKDLENGKQKGLDSALMDRLELTDARIDSMADGLIQIAALPDPVGEISQIRTRPSGIQVGQMRVPLGVVGIIYESRPNVTADAAALCLKSGNATILRGGSEAFESNQAIAALIHKGLKQAGLPEDAVQVLTTTDRDAVGELISMPDYVDVIVPRGGKGLIERIAGEARVPVIKHLDGICHIYVDDHADSAMAVAICVNAKTQRYGTCNTMESLLVAESKAAEFLPQLYKQLKEKQVEIRGCDQSRKILTDITTATEQDYGTEYLAPIMSLKIVSGLEEAMDHIDRYGSHHTDAIITEDYARAHRFLREVDSSSVMVNASTRFADGFEYGLGAEIGISTDKFHARGPVGLEGLTSMKYIVLGHGETRS